MSRKEIPAHTQVSCDRCSAVIDDYDELYDWLEVRVKETGQRTTYDMCKQCMMQFWFWMGKNDVKGEL